MRALFVCDGVPYPADQGDRIRCHHILLALAAAYRVTLVCPVSSPVPEEAVRNLRRICEDVVLVRRLACEAIAGPLLHPFLPLTVSRRWSPRLRSLLRRMAAERRFDVTFACQLKMVPYALAAAGGLVAADLTDCISLYLRRSAGRESNPAIRTLLALEARRVERYERLTCHSVDLVLVSSAVDRSALEHVGSGTPVAPILVVPNGARGEAADMAARRLPERRDGLHSLLARLRQLGGPNILFLGNMGYPPNEDAAVWFARDVFPLVRKAAPDAQFLVVGKNPSGRVRALARLAGVHVTGWVPDPRVWLGVATVVVNPVRFGSGTRLKLLEAMGEGKAVVSTSTGAEGLEAQPGVHFEVSDTTEEIARRVVELISDPGRREALGRRAWELVQSRYRWETIGADLVAELQKIAARKASPERGRL